MPLGHRVLVGLSIPVIAFLLAIPAEAAIVYGTKFTNPGQVVRIDTTSGQVTPLLTTGNSPDSLVFDGAGRIIYTVFGTNQLRRFDPAIGAASDVLVASGFSGPLDLALDPGGATVLVSSALAPRIDRVNLSSGAVTPFVNTGGAGIAYDNSGRLFANLPGIVAELNPVTGAVVQSTSGVFIPSFDGLTFDPSTGNLFATDGTGTHLYRLNRNNLAAGAQLVTTIAQGNFVDGIAADGSGNLFVAVRNTGNESASGLFVVNATTGATSQVAFVPFLDDIAPLVGLGSPPVATAPAAVVPTLSSLTLFALSIALAGLALGAVRTSTRRTS